jgi:hypothetical protein
MIIPELSASKVAGFLGLHKYQPVHELQYELLLKDKDTRERILALERTQGRRGFNVVLNEILKEQPVMDCIQMGIRDASKTSDVSSVLEDVEAQARLVLDLRKDTMPAELRNRLASEIRGKVSKGRGIQNETAILDAYETRRDVKVTERNTKTIKKDFGTFKLVGRCDGYVASENRIVDSKDRTRWWPQVPLYDEIQLRCYMNMYDAQESELVERFPDGRTRHTTYTNDPEKWESLKTSLEAAVAKLNRIVEDEEALTQLVVANTVHASYPVPRNPPSLSGTATLADV